MEKKKGKKIQREKEEESSNIRGWQRRREWQEKLSYYTDPNAEFVMLFLKQKKDTIHFAEIENSEPKNSSFEH